MLLTTATLLATATALLACAVIAGVFFAFSSFVMQSLARLPPGHGIGAMQAINIVVINRSFLGVFFAGAVLSLLAGVLALSQPLGLAGWCIVAGAALYLVGTFLATVVGNIPLNRQLAAMNTSDGAAHAFWADYLERWTWWNHVRTTCALLAAVCHLVGLLLMDAP